MYDLEKISNIPIREVAERLGLKLKKQGANYVTNCLWHDDKHPSMVVGGKINTCYCYGCKKEDATHGVLDLVMKANNMDFKEACEWLEWEGYNVVSQRSKPQVSRSKIKRLEALQARKVSGESLDVREDFLYFKPDYLSNTINLDNSFARCLVEVFGEEAAMRVVQQYKLGSYEMKYGYPAVMFPLIDKQEQILDIKAQTYDCNPMSQTFFHKLKTCFWLGSTLNRDVSFSHDCLFGEHLLPLFPAKIVLLVESPKNACVGAAKYPEYLWLATGNKGMLKREILEVLRGRNVIVFPDNDAYDEWNAKLQQMQDITLFACMHVPEGCGEKGDIADWILKAHPSPHRSSLLASLEGQKNGASLLRSK